VSEKKIEPGQSWEVDLFRPEDAEGVSQLFLQVYGEGYPIRTFIDPVQLTAENAAARTISSVARTPKGDIVGHNALFQSAPYKRIYELGAGLVHPLYRGGAGVATKLLSYCVELAARKNDIEGIYGEPVCNHVFIQKVCAGSGFVTHAVEVDLMPADAYSKEKSARGRVSSLLDSKTFRSKPHPAFVPPIYRESLEFIYSGLDDVREIRTGDEPLPVHVKTELDVQVFNFAQVARIAVSHIGGNIGEVLADQEHRLDKPGISVIQVWLNLAQPWTGAAVEHLRKRGYFLGGLLPRWFDTDGILMQKIKNTPCWEDIQLYTDRARKIVSLARADWETANDNKL
jgi:hypothetical protein